MSKGTLFDKTWDAHTVTELPGGKSQIYVGMHLIHEVTSPQAFDMLKEKGLSVRNPESAVAVEDHVIPTDDRSHPYKDGDCEIMSQDLLKNCERTGIKYFAHGSGNHGVCHVLFPELGAIWPGRITVMGDSHTSTHGAFGALAFGIGTTQVSHVLATQTLAMPKPKVVRINFDGGLEKGVTAKDLALHMIRTLGVSGGNGCAYELRGDVIDGLDMEQRMTLCNMGVEGGAKSVYINPDQKTFDFLRGRPLSPQKDFDKAVSYWSSLRTDSDAEFDDVRNVSLKGLEPMVTWGINPEQVIGISERVPYSSGFKGNREANAEKAFAYIGLEQGNHILGTFLDRVFIGSCTNGRLSDMVMAAEILHGKSVSVPTMLSYGSEKIMNESIALGYDKTFRDAGVDVRLPGCSMCLAMNPDRLIGEERCASTSNRNFIGRQGSKTGRTHLVSPYTAAASAVEGKFADPRGYLK